MRSTRLIGVTLAAFLATSLGGAASAADMAGGCSIEVAQMEDEYRREYITGMSVLADVSSSRRPDSFAELSCLERLMNSVMDVFFEPPGLPDLLGELENFICDQATEVFREVSGEMAHRFDANLPVGEIIPGVNLGSMRGSMRVRVREGGGYKSEEVSLQDMFNEGYRIPDQSEIQGLGIEDFF